VVCGRGTAARPLLAGAVQVGVDGRVDEGTRGVHGGEVGVGRSAARRQPQQRHLAQQGVVVLARREPQRAGIRSQHHRTASGAGAGAADGGQLQASVQSPSEASTAAASSSPEMQHHTTLPGVAEALDAVAGADRGHQLQPATGRGVVVVGPGSRQDGVVVAHLDAEVVGSPPPR
jgi:hypothetical protein